ncbi:MAG: nitroreductase family deazaflavin-dependent oxidoreductase [Gammaproteobacteria bacterium]|jgi:deazaflavin-dependent oxidoreductase (nitroreductase family)|nr:nitroreductase family deazaflavin-dependent oxidoreductase [Gammaproteobacteria bacterium]MBT5054533.1 nitroreductase family deazaflavin-dependent oxidoreductase [Gammaproteobacteria bacterium]
MKAILLQWMLNISSTTLGGRFFVALLSPIDRWLLLKTNGVVSIAGLGTPTLLLTTSGRKTGQPRATPLMYLSDEHDPTRLYVIGSSGGRPEMPAWVLNLMADPKVLVTRDGEIQNYQASALSGAQHSAIWQRFIRFNPGFTHYEGRLNRSIPIIELAPRANQALRFTAAARFG